MKRMKKIGALAMACAMCAGVSMQSLATEASTDFTFEYKNDPTYTVSIPDSVTLTQEGTEMSITAEDVAYLDGQKVSVTIAGTSAYRDQMVLEGKTESGGNASLRYQFIMDDGSVIESNAGQDIVAVGKEVASFTENGTQSFTVKPGLEGSSSIKKGDTYTGSMTYSMELVDA